MCNATWRGPFAIPARACSSDPVLRMFVSFFSLVGFTSKSPSRALSPMIIPSYTCNETKRKWDQNREPGANVQKAELRGGRGNRAGGASGGWACAAILARLDLRADEEGPALLDSPEGEKRRGALRAQKAAGVRGRAEGRQTHCCDVRASSLCGQKKIRAAAMDCQVHPPRLRHRHKHALPRLPEASLDGLVPSEGAHEQALHDGGPVYTKAFSHSDWMADRRSSQGRTVI